MRSQNIGRVASLLAVAVLALAGAACGSPGETLDPAAPTGRVAASAVDGRFQFTFAVERGVVRSGQVLTGEATLGLLVPGGVTLSGAGIMIGFDFLEVGGERRHVAPVWEADCRLHRVLTDTPILSPILKSGAVEGPHADFLRDFLRGTDVRLPKGTWDITAIAKFYEGEGCRGLLHTVQGTVRIHVTE